MSVVKNHPFFTLLSSWEKLRIMSLLDELDRRCDLMYAKTNDLSDITLINLRFQCQHKFKVPQFLTLVEITKDTFYTQLKYFFSGEFTVVRLVVYMPRKTSKRVAPIISANLEIYLLPQ